MNRRGIERRLFPRKIVSMDVVFEDEFGEGVLCLTAEDVSLGGLFISTDIPIKLSSYVFLSFKLPGSKEIIHATGQVMRITKKDVSEEAGLKEGMGIRFVGLSCEAAREISEFVS